MTDRPTRKRRVAYGANPLPEDQKSKLRDLASLDPSLKDKTEESILFVIESAIFLETCTDPTSRKKLEDAMEQIKDGTLVFNTYTTPEQYLASN